MSPKQFITAILASLVLCSAVWATFGGFARAGRPISDTDRTKILRSTEPILRAIRRYEAENGHPPATLADLVPRYLSRDAPPLDPIFSGRDYLYKTESGQWSIGVPVRDERDGVLTYSSKGQYPPGKPGVSVERVGAWAYYHGNPF